MRHTRRHVVRAGIWTAPAVAVSVAAPAYAEMSGGGGSLDIVATVLSGQDGTRSPWEWQLRVTNIEGPGTVAAGTLTVTVPIPLGVVLGPNPDRSPNWTCPTPELAGPRTYVFTWGLPLAPLSETTDLIIRLEDNDTVYHAVYASCDASGFGGDSAQLYA